jgi:hypothetical protein
MPDPLSRALYVVDLRLIAKRRLPQVTRDRVAR